MPPLNDVAKTVIATGDIGLISIALMVTMPIILLLVALALYQYKTRVKSQQKVVDTLTDAQRQTHQKAELIEGKVDNVKTAMNFLENDVDRYKDTMEKRLSAGADKMAALDGQIIKLRELNLTDIAKTITEEKFDKYKHEHVDLHKGLDSRLESLRCGQEEVKLAVKDMSSNLSGRIDIMTDLLSKKIRIENKKPKSDEE